MNTLEITKKKENNKLTVTAAGRIDTVTSPELEEQIKPELGDITELVLNFEKLNYISSSGLRALLGFHKTMTAKGGKFTITKPTDMVLEVFEVTGFSDILNIEQ